MGILAPDLQMQYDISNVQYGYIQSAFALSYACGQLISGGLLDRFGTRLGYAVSLTGWSIASMLHALPRGTWRVGFMRGVLRVAEPPALPAATNPLAECFPRRERARAYRLGCAG